MGQEMTLKDFEEEGMGLFWGFILRWWRALLAIVRANFGYFYVLRLC